MSHEGNLTISTAEDAAKYATLTSVGGDLFINTNANLAALTSVDGDLSINNVDAKLDALTSVGGTLFINAATTLKK
jgi:hypothetical protein